MQDIGLVGLGVMGRNLALNMMNHGYNVSGYNLTFKQTQELIDMQNPRFEGFETIKDMVQSLSVPRKVFVMVPAGKPVDEVIDEVVPYLEKGDIIMDGGNSFYKDTEARYEKLKALGIHYYGVGVSGGAKGALNGPSIMPSGDKEIYQEVGKILEDISAKYEGDPCCTYIGPKGSGHYVKMVHNGIEYADMQLLVEVYLLLKYGCMYDNAKISSVLSSWNQKEARSYLVEITASILKEKDDVTEHDLVDMIKDVAGNKGTGRWTSIEALKQEYNASMLSAAYAARVMSNQVEMRKTYHEVLGNEKDVLLKEDTIYKAYILAKSLAYGQGFGLYEDASKRYGWDLNFEKIASIFRDGCIIQSYLLQKIMDAYQNGATCLLESKEYQKEIQLYANDLKEVVIHGLSANIAIPVFTNALLYLVQLSTTQLGANLIQAQRDYFGAHTFERIDQDGMIHHEWSESHD